MHPPCSEDFVAEGAKSNGNCATSGLPVESRHKLSVRDSPFAPSGRYLVEQCINVPGWQWTVDVRTRTTIWSQRKRGIVEAWKEEKEATKGWTAGNRFFRKAGSSFVSKKIGKQ